MKKKKSREEVATESPIKPDCGGCGEYALGQVAATLSILKEHHPTVQPGKLEDKRGLLAMFGPMPMGSVSSVACAPGVECAPHAGSAVMRKGLEKRKAAEGEDKQSGLKERKKKRQLPESANGIDESGKDVKTSISENLKSTKGERVPLKEWLRPNQEDAKRTVFVGNLPITFDKKKLQKLFCKFGEIKSIRFRSVAPSDPDLPRRVIAQTKQYHPDRNSMNSYIVFQSEEAAKKALKRNGKVVGNNHIRVDLAANSRKHDTKHSVFLGNLPFDVSDDVIRKHFDECGRVENVRVIRDGKTGLGKGFGYLLFAEDVSVEFALKLNGSRMAGRDIRVQRATKKKQSAVNAMKRLQMKEAIQSKRNGGVKGRATPARIKKKQGTPRRSKSGQIRTKGKGPMKKSRTGTRHEKLMKGRRKKARK
ncbi:RNA-binding protein 34-like isoform X1 [Acanthaster planci]|uniref:RNA-binding protein 34-like isoform X1 n=1 Tax=Acanthaster planci TaxID=133434 RepID=A0A8B7Y6X7_ACAPL|nr:RNA-binding protein 34-like isoform X1 [Acanthaster planci]